MTSDNRQTATKVLKNKILASMILTPMVPFILLAVVGYYFFTTSLEGEISSRMVRVAEDHRKGIELFLSERVADLKLVSESYSFQELSSPGKLAQVFDHLRNVSSAYVDLGLFNRQGKQVSYAGPYQLAGKQYGDKPWFREVLARGTFISDVFLGFRQVPHFIVALKVIGDDQVWVLRATIDTLYFSDLVEKVRMGRTGEAYIINQQGFFQTERRSGGDLLEKDRDSGGFPAPKPGVTTFIRQAADGEEYLYASTSLNEGKWRLVVRQEEYDAFRGLHHAAYIVVLILCVGLALISLAAVVITNYLIGRITRAEEEKDKLTQQLIMAGRLAEIGEMSAGFAHEINNPLQIIRSEHALVTSILDDSLSQGQAPQGEDLEELKDSMDQIRTQVDRCGGITQGILKFARQKENQPAPVDLAEFLPGVMDLVRKKIEVEGIDFTLDMTEDIPRVMADKGQLQQVVLNLINNAIYAVSEKHRGGGRVAVGLSSQNGRVSLSVSDNGGGIPPEIMEKIFMPFFTTKPVGKGTGLGLSVCFGIVEAMGGTLEVAGDPGQGATFTVSLPVAANGPGQGLKNHKEQ